MQVSNKFSEDIRRYVEIDNTIKQAQISIKALKAEKTATAAAINGSNLPSSARSEGVNRSSTRRATPMRPATIMRWATAPASVSEIR